MQIIVRFEHKVNPFVSLAEFLLQGVLVGVQVDGVRQVFQQGATFGRAGAVATSWCEATRSVSNDQFPMMNWIMGVAMPSGHRAAIVFIWPFCCMVNAMAIWL
ncbi:hypothetical protein OEG84_04720 [Hoeflea sp. G2-23]|uniref:Uncharacterized protein n=1 Tax=Hoeflea algicola TaxID=2983763 RepID=A0ABT3Z5J7_9HYPH|nr:hypothetical protein [Hoeflea algicola]MCY0147039.1 hypothetical protein [Hoeflea algicola]